MLAPAVGAILMSASTIVVALNAQLLRRVRLRPQDLSAAPIVPPTKMAESVLSDRAI